MYSIFDESQKLVISNLISYKYFSFKAIQLSSLRPEYNGSERVPGFNFGGFYFLHFNNDNQSNNNAFSDKVVVFLAEGLQLGISSDNAWVLGIGRLCVYIELIGSGHLQKQINQ